MYPILFSAKVLQLPVHVTQMKSLIPPSGIRELKGDIEQGK